MRVILHVFYRTIEVHGLENVSADCPIILTGIHTNGLLDAAVVVVACPRPLSFVCKSTLLDIPVLGSLLKQLGAVPVRRRQDFLTASGQQQKQDNRAAFEGMQRCLERNGALAIFPEGISHNESDLQELKPGFAIAAIQTLTDQPTIPYIDICPVGLNYLNKSGFRSDIFVDFSHPIRVTAEDVQQQQQQQQQTTPPPPNMQQRHALVSTLCEQLQTHLKQVTLVAPSFMHIHLLSLARALYMDERVCDSSKLYIETMQRFVAKWAQLELLQDDETKQLLSDVRLYDTQLQLLYLRDREVFTMSSLSWTSMVFRLLFLMFVMLPIALPGLVVQGPVVLVAYYAGKKWSGGYDDQVASFRILGGLAMTIVMWILFGSVLFWLYGFGTMMLGMLLAIACGLVVA